MDGSGSGGHALLGVGNRSGTPLGKDGAPHPPHHRRRVSSFAALASSTTSKASLLGFLAIVCVFPFLFSSVSQQQQALEQYGAPGFRYEPLSKQQQPQAQPHLRTRAKPSPNEAAAAAPGAGQESPRPQYEPQGAASEGKAKPAATAAKPKQQQQPPAKQPAAKQQKEGPTIYMDWVLPSDRCVLDHPPSITSTPD